MPPKKDGPLARGQRAADQVGFHGRDDQRNNTAPASSATFDEDLPAGLRRVDQQADETTKPAGPPFQVMPPLSDDEGELTDEIAADLEMAYSLDPTGDLPWREWAELLGIIEADRDGRTVQGIEPEVKAEVFRLAAASSASPALGYRRLPVRVSVGGGWSIEIPGVFAEGVSEDGRTWYGWDHHRRVVAQL